MFSLYVLSDVQLWGRRIEVAFIHYNDELQVVQISNKKKGENNLKKNYFGESWNQPLLGLPPDYQCIR